MSYANPTTHNGFLITAYACELPEGCWQGQLVLSKCGFEEVRQANLEIAARSTRRSNRPWPWAGSSPITCYPCALLTISNRMLSFRKENRVSCSARK